MQKKWKHLLQCVEKLGINACSYFLAETGKTEKSHKIFQFLSGEWWESQKKKKFEECNDNEEVIRLAQVKRGRGLDPFVE